MIAVTFLAFFSLGCRLNHPNSQLHDSEADLFKRFYDTIPNIILPFHGGCPCGPGILLDKERILSTVNLENRKENIYIPSEGFVIGKIIKPEYILIAYDIPTSGTNNIISTYTKDGHEIGGISLFHTECDASISDYEKGYVSFDRDMRIIQIDSVFKYKKTIDGKDIDGLPPYLAEIREFKYQISDSGKFVKIK